MTSHNDDDDAERTIGQLVADATHDISSIVRSEVALAKAEIKADALKAGLGAGMFAAAGTLAFLALILVSGIGALPTIGEYLPGRLFSWGATLMLGGTGTAWPAFGISLGIIALALLVACLIFRRQEV